LSKYKKRKNSDTNSEASSSIHSRNLSIVKKKIPKQNAKLPMISTSDGITVLNYGKIVFD
jgi:hypothetical protein